MSRKTGNSDNTIEKAQSKKFNTTFRGLGSFIRFNSRNIDFSVAGAMDFHLGDVYLSMYCPIKKEYALRGKMLDSSIAAIPDDLRNRIMAFLEDCVVSKAAIYRRDCNGFVWEVFDEQVYRTCCQKHGFSESDNLMGQVKEENTEFREEQQNRK